MTIEPNKEEQFEEQPEEPNVKGYKVVCAKLGLVMCVYFICRIASAIITGLAFRSAPADLSQTMQYAIGMSVAIIVVYIIPMLFTARIFNSFSYYNILSKETRAMYKKPKRLARAMGTFPAMYGLGYGIALLTMLAAFLISRATGGQTLIEEMLRPTVLEPTTSIASAVMMVFMLVIIAPIFEEIWVRGIMYDALKPYGQGIAILISSILFGLMHGSLNMLFYTTALGFALGYVRYATNSILVVTLLHAIINAIAAGLLFIMALVEITGEYNRLINTIQNIYILAVLALVVVGIIAFIKKIPTIRKYRIEKTWQEISPKRKVALFFLSIPVIIMLVLAFNEITQFWAIGLLI